MAATTKVPSGITIWNAMRDELLMNMYQLPFTTLPPTIFHIYLHPGDYERIEGIVPRIVSELQKALTAEVKKINEGRARTGGMLSRLIEQEEASPIEIPATGWHRHAAPVLLLGLSGRFRLLLPGGRGETCHSALIR